MARPRRDAGAVPADRRILDEFSQMVLEKPLSEVTVDALCRKAGCNKTTFYYHYATFSDVVKRYLEELGADTVLECALDALLGEGEHLPSNAGSCSAVRRKPANLPRKYDELCLLMAKNQHGLIHEHMEDTVRKHAAAVLGEGKKSSTPRQEMLVSFTVGGIMRLMAYRGKAGNAIGLEELVDLFYPEIFPAIIKAADEG